MRAAFLVWAMTLGLGATPTEAQTPPGAEPTPELPESIAGKKLSELLEDWPDQYVRWILTRAERDVYESLSTDHERLQFIEYFWKRRDPDPETPENEYRRDYLERYAFVANYLSAGKPGWATDRGRVYLILGPPHSMQRNPMGRHGLERPSEIWTYNNLDIPNVPASVDFRFVDFNGTGDFELVQDIDTTAPIWTQFGTANNALDAIAQRRFRIGEVDPRTGFERFRDVDGTRYVMREFDLQQQVRDVLATPERELPPLRTAVETRASFGELGVTASGGALGSSREGESPPSALARVPVHFTVPYRSLVPRTEGDARRYEIDYAIVATGPDGEEAARVEDELAVRYQAGEVPELGRLRLSVEETLELAPGEYVLRTYVRDRVEDRLGSAEFPLTVPEPRAASLYLSTVFLASDIIKIKGGAGEGKPFQFGSVRVVPSTSRLYRPDDALKLYVEAYGASAGEDGRKRLRVDFFVMRDGRLFLGVPASYLRPDQEPVGITGEIPLRKCTPGEYVLRVRVTDEVSGDRAEMDAPFAIASP